MLRACLPLMISGMLSLSARAEETSSFFNFFGGKDIDYWQEGKIVKDHFSTRRSTATADKKTPESFQGANILRHGDSKKFSWDTYKDPSAPEFWDDGGDWIPPRPFREAAANPTHENVQNYLNWMAQKGMVVTKFQAELAKASGLIGQDNPATPVPWNRVEIKYFYQSSCPHCVASKPTVEKLVALGAKVVFIQLDAGMLAPLHEPSIGYDQNLRRSFPVSVTPTWYLKLGKVETKVTGEQSLNDLIQHLLSLKGANP